MKKNSFWGHTCKFKKDVIKERSIFLKVIYVKSSMKNTNLKTIVLAPGHPMGMKSIRHPPAGLHANASWAHLVPHARTTSSPSLIPPSPLPRAASSPSTWPPCRRSVGAAHAGCNPRGSGDLSNQTLGNYHGFIMFATGLGRGPV